MLLWLQVERSGKSAKTAAVSTLLRYSLNYSLCVNMSRSPLPEQML